MPMKAKGYLDLLIPHGGAGLINAVVEKCYRTCYRDRNWIVHVYVGWDDDEDKGL